MKVIILLFLLITPMYSNANFATGFVLGRSSKHCSCTEEEYKIRELEQENQKLKKELQKCKEEE